MTEEVIYINFSKHRKNLKVKSFFKTANEFLFYLLRSVFVAVSNCFVLRDNCGIKKTVKVYVVVALGPPRIRHWL